MMNCCPICSVTLENTMRATMSFAPPGGKGTITRTGFAGNAWDQAAPAAQIEQAKNAANTRDAFIEFPRLYGASAVTQISKKPPCGGFFACAENQSSVSTFTRRWSWLLPTQNVTGVVVLST